MTLNKDVFCFPRDTS